MNITSIGLNPPSEAEALKINQAVKLAAVILVAHDF